MIELYKNYIFDFDGTIANIQVDWNALKSEVNLICDLFIINKQLPLNQKLDQLKKHVCVKSILLKYEQPEGVINYTPNNHVVSLIKNLDLFFVVSNNLHSTVVNVLDELGLMKNCGYVVAIDDVINSKPNKESYEMLKENLLGGSSVYIGDRKTDRLYAIECGLIFKDVKEFL